MGVAFVQTSAAGRTGSLFLRLSLALAVLQATAARAAPPRQKQDSHDLQVEVRTRYALSRDQVLAPLNLSVHVESGVATLSGPVPSKGLLAHALAVVKGVQGIYEVRNDLRLNPACGEDVTEGVLQGMASNVALDLSPVPSGLEDAGSGLRGSLQGPPDNRPLQPRFTAHPELPGREREDWVPPATVPHTPVLLGAPVALFLAPGREGAAPGRTMSQPGRDASDLQATIERLRAADARFLNLRAEVRDGVVVLSGRVRRGEDIIGLARVLSRLPGVRQVDLLQVMWR